MVNFVISLISVPSANAETVIALPSPLVASNENVISLGATIPIEPPLAASAASPLSSFRAKPASLVK